MLDEHYINPQLASLYDDDSGWSVDRDFYVRFVGPTPRDVLDIGCGTGLIARKLVGAGHTVVGVDPALAMMEVGKNSPNGEHIKWIEGTAQTLELNRRFDRVIMTGNAFQVLHHAADLEATFSTMRNHLCPDGLIAFETRNPMIDWSSRWEYTLQLERDGQTITEHRRVLSVDGPLLTFELCYHFPDRTLRSRSTLRFWPKDTIAQHIQRAGLVIKACYGDWHDGPRLDTSEQMIFVVAHQ